MKATARKPSGTPVSGVRRTSRRRPAADSRLAPVGRSPSTAPGRAADQGQQVLPGRPGSSRHRRRIHVPDRRTARDLVVLMVRDPYWLFAYWEFSPDLNDNFIAQAGRGDAAEQQARSARLRRHRHRRGQPGRVSRHRRRARRARLVHQRHARRERLLHRHRSDPAGRVVRGHRQVEPRVASAHRPVGRGRRAMGHARVARRDLLAGRARPDVRFRRMGLRRVGARLMTLDSAPAGDSFIS